MSKTVKNLKTLKQLGFGIFKAIETIGYRRSKAVWKLLNNVSGVFSKTTRALISMTIYTISTQRMLNQGILTNHNVMTGH